MATTITRRKGRLTKVPLVVVLAAAVLAAVGSFGQGPGPHGGAVIAAQPLDQFSLN